MRCRITANFRATAILAFLEPIRFTSLSPPGLDLPRFYYFHPRVRSSLSGWLRSRNGKEVKELETLVDYAAFRIMISARSLDSEIKHKKNVISTKRRPAARGIASCTNRLENIKASPVAGRYKHEPYSGNRM